MRAGNFPKSISTQISMKFIFKSMMHVKSSVNGDWILFIENVALAGLFVCDFIQNECKWNYGVRRLRVAFCRAIHLTQIEIESIKQMLNCYRCRWRVRLSSNVIMCQPKRKKRPTLKGHNLDTFGNSKRHTHTHTHTVHASSIDPIIFTIVSVFFSQTSWYRIIFSPFVGF